MPRADENVFEKQARVFKAPANKSRLRMMLTSSRAVTIGLVCAGALIICVGVYSNANAGSPEASNPSDADSTAGHAGGVADRVIVYYFHWAIRCQACLGVQAIVEKTIKDRFKAETASSVLAYLDVNLDLPENRHFKKEFDLDSTGMVVVARKGRTTLKWEKCEKTWDFTQNEPALADYIEERIRAYVGKLE